jgi:deoxyribonuclease-1
MNKEYRYMQADLYNLFPAIGAVNTMRSNYNFTVLPGEKSDFGVCVMKIQNKKAEPPVEAEVELPGLIFIWKIPIRAIKRVSSSESLCQLQISSFR